MFEMNRKIQFRDSVRFITKDNVTLVANTDNAESVFLSHEVVHAIIEASKESYTFTDFLKCIEEQESCEYMNKVLNKLDYLKMFVSDETAITSECFKITIDTTDNCNLRCKHCCVAAGEHKKGADLDYNDLKKVIDSVIEVNPKLLCISGGEPLCRSDFKEMVMYIRQTFKNKMILMTNAVLITDEIAKIIVENFDEVNVSLDGYDEESVSEIRGDGVFEKTVAGIKCLNKFGMTEGISLSTIITKKNQNKIKEFNELCNLLNVKPIYRNLSFIGRAEKNKNGIERPNQEKCVIDINPEEIRKIKQPIFSCQGGRTEFEIDYKGNIYPCASMMDEEFLMGNIFKIPNLKKYLESGEVRKNNGYEKFASYFPYNIPECKNCDYNLFCFSCTLAVKEKKEEGTLGKVCQYNKKAYSCYWKR